MSSLLIPYTRICCAASLHTLVSSCLLHPLLELDAAGPPEVPGPRVAGKGGLSRSVLGGGGHVALAEGTVFVIT